ncbi:hypothetical protein C8R44DRAFT_641015, partial [Mycena epipterygia]
WGFEWAALVHDFLDFESGWGYEDSWPQITAKERPKQVGEWLGRACKWEAVVTIVDVDGEVSFASQWWIWWRALQPEDWRVVAKMLSLPMLDAEDWSGVAKLHGRNGLLQVMATLLWWGEKVADHPIEQMEWSLAVADVGWVMGELPRDKWVSCSSNWIEAILTRGSDSGPRVGAKRKRRAAEAEER